MLGIKLYMKLEIAKKIVGLVLLLSSMWISVKAMAYSLLIGSIASQIINAWPNRKLLNYSYLDQIKDISPSILLSLFMGGVVYDARILPFSDIWLLIIQIVLGVSVYLIGSIFFRFESYRYLLSILKAFFI